MRVSAGHSEPFFFVRARRNADRVGGTAARGHRTMGRVYGPDFMLQLCRLSERGTGPPPLPLRWQARGVAGKLQRPA